ncbi:MAG: PEP-utilizing enzyme [Peptococcaceae bacterium]|nr:PEP-utilizing enzyme [Peptococcaceae bacterium]
MVGGKGWNLARLARYGFNVPAGGVLTVAGYRLFVAENGLGAALDGLGTAITVENAATGEVEEKLAALRERILGAPVPGAVGEALFGGLTAVLDQPLAVRSSAGAEDGSGASFAGIHDSFLNVRGREGILSAVKGCYASLWTSRAVAYRRKMGIADDGVLPAVVIMAMVEAVAAGVAFTCDPRTGRRDLVVIGANFGLGESVVGGAVDPDEYRVNYRGEIVEVKAGRKEGRTVARPEGGTEFIRALSPAGPVLSRPDIAGLGRLIIRVFDSLGRGEEHQDVEWVSDGHSFTLVQARPVTVLPRYTVPALKNQPEIWSNANFRDAIPMVLSTLSWSLIRLNLEDMLMVPFQAAGYRLPGGLQAARLFAGRAYMNLSLTQWLYYDSIGFPPRMVNEAFGGHQPEIDLGEAKTSIGVGLARSWRLVKLLKVARQARKRAQTSFARIDAFMAAAEKEDWTNLADGEVAEKLSAVGQTTAAFGLEFILLGFGSGAYSRLAMTLGRYFPDRGPAMANALMAGAGDITSAEQGYRLVELAETARDDGAARRFLDRDPFCPLAWEEKLPEDSPFKLALRAFLAEFGHRGIYEAEIANPRWREDPSFILGAVRGTYRTASLAGIRAAQREKSASVRREVERHVPFPGRLAVRYWLGQALAGAALRELGKSMLVKPIELSRRLLLEVGRRLVERGVLAEPNDVFHCAGSEVSCLLQGEWDGRGLAVLVEERKIRQREMEAQSPPDVVIDEVPHRAAPAHPAGGRVLTGIGVAAGAASGMVRIVPTPVAGEKLTFGDVLVAPSTDPAWTPLFLRAAALVMETGGCVSHGAIVAREYGIPAVVNVPGVLGVLSDGQRVTVDGDAGKVYL